jgi:CheY-like chemotaxis protein
MVHVLLVDADKQLSDSYAKYLKNAGYSVALAPSAKSALTACEQKIPDIIVLELQLQGHSGLEFLQELKTYPEWNDIPILLHTFVPQDNLNNLEQAFKSYGIVNYAYKPETSLKRLVSFVEDALAVKL